MEVPLSRHISESVDCCSHSYPIAEVSVVFQIVLIEKEISMVIPADGGRYL